MEPVGRNAVHPEELRPGQLLRTQEQTRPLLLAAFLLPAFPLSHCRPAFSGSLVTRPPQGSHVTFPTTPS